MKMLLLENEEISKPSMEVVSIAFSHDVHKLRIHYYKKFPNVLIMYNEISFRPSDCDFFRLLVSLSTGLSPFLTASWRVAGKGKWR